MSEYIDVIIRIAEGLTALGVIWIAARKFNRAMNAIEQAKAKLQSIEEHNFENHMSLLRLTIMSNEMPIGERIGAGIKYLKYGGNGEVKKFLKEKFNIDETVDEAPHYKK